MENGKDGEEKGQREKGKRNREKGVGSGLLLVHKMCYHLALTGVIREVGTSTT